ncbi:MAG: phospholipase D-like domain-containing protein [Ralstonia sp.]|uniref:phospholipase n=1 Tax=unclassified Ralstonia TaxID=209769 RepID=UPI0039B0ED3F
MGAPEKQIHQIVGKDGKPAKTAASAPGCFLQGDEFFSKARKGNAVHYYPTGAEYFEQVASAIENAKTCVFIAGWQVNFDVVLTGKKTLWTCLRTATQHGAIVYVMPWMSPKVGVDTGDFETALAVIQLNAGLQKPRAFVLPAVSQCDQVGALGIAFSHHQKQVVIDNKVAFVGGIDLAYGRRDDGRFLLTSDGRTGSELYNSCVPQIHSLTNVEQSQYLTRAELVAACFDNKLGNVAQFLLSAPIKELAMVMDAWSGAKGKIQETKQEISDWWDTVDLVPEFIHKAQEDVEQMKAAIRVGAIDAGQNAATGLAQWSFHKLDQTTQTKLKGLWDFGSAQVQDAATALVAWLNGASLANLPPKLLEATAQSIQAFVIRVVLALQAQGDQRKTCYENLEKLGKLLPTGGKSIDPQKQPRMPWHDVHSRVEGPSVYDLSRNFVRRWNGVAKQYELSDGKTVEVLLRKMGTNTPLKVQRIAAEHRPIKPTGESTDMSGNCWVQLLRSAPLKMRKAEAIGEGEREAPTVRESGCLSAMQKAIHGAVHFLYIEGQFFQSQYGEDVVGDTDGAGTKSGPMRALMDLTGSPGYQKYAKQLGIEGIPAAKWFSRVRWSQVDIVQRDLKGGGKDFINDLKKVLASQAAIAGFGALGPAQKTLLNPIGKALGDRITRAIQDDLPFHVYIVLPAHPEGTLDTLNIMTQLHLTMQSLVFGTNSLVNRVRRALLAKQYMKGRKVPWAQAERDAGAVDTEELDRSIRTEDWEQYLTLLNLRNWGTIGGRPVTEQIYIHSKLLIADDRTVVLGSANINDRSQIGDRDSELAAIMHDDTSVSVPLDGTNMQRVGASAHSLRKALWSKHFGLLGGAEPASDMAALLDKPADPKTWLAIKGLAVRNAQAYQKAFPFLPKLGISSSIWPTWNPRTAKLDGYMPFNERFWRNPEKRDESFTWDAKQLLPEHVPTGVRGFVVALPAMWTRGEDNNSGMNLTTLADIGPEGGSDTPTQTAALSADQTGQATT